MKPQPEAHKTRRRQSSSEPPLPKLAIELGPLLVFFAGNALAGIYAARPPSWWRR